MRWEKAWSVWECSFVIGGIFITSKPVLMFAYSSVWRRAAPAWEDARLFLVSWSFFNCQVQPLCWWAAVAVGAPQSERETRPRGPDHRTANVCFSTLVWRSSASLNLWINVGFYVKTRFSIISVKLIKDFRKESNKNVFFYVICKLVK